MPAQFLWLIPCLPLLGFIANGLIALLSASSERGPERKIVAAIAVGMPALASIVCVYATAVLLRGDLPMIPQFAQWTWFSGANWEITMGFHFDYLTAFMLSFVLGVGTLIHLYAVGYMAHDRGFARFFAYFNLFLFFMVVLVMADNAILTFLGWEGVGLCSYLLIGFWHKDHANNNAARKAFIINRVGDLGLLLGLLAVVLLQVNTTGSWDLSWTGIAAWAQNHATDPGVVGSGLLLAAVLLIFLGCAGKSAQIPLFTWLPDAMAGPTPVSALIHAATMVTAGIYLCARFADVIVLSPLAMTIIVTIAIATALYAAILALVQWDIKKILAYSTVSQLGFMFMAVGVGAFDVALFHVFTHAFFKAALFLGAGSIIHALHHEQDIRRMGGLAKAMPGTYSPMFFAWYAIIGLPLGAGFMSKELILDRLVLVPGYGPVLWALALIAAFLTAVYMTRMMYYVFWSPSRRQHEPEPLPMTMLAPPAILGFASLVVGGVWFALMPGADFLARWLEPVVAPAQEVLAQRVWGGEMPYNKLKAILLAIVGVGVIIVGAVWARSRFRLAPCDPQAEGLSATGMRLTHAFDRLYDTSLVRPTMALARGISRSFELVILPGVNQWIARTVHITGVGYQRVQRPRMRSGLILSLFGVVIIMLIVVWDILGRAS
ncbi:MAG: NADH-quinone oxidoreductase subunit L [Planctomycetota bacterium]|nr:MAG: NADH-quinone oxidoreductase subunit L [Planctomycetota bacterium]